MGNHGAVSYLRFILLRSAPLVRRPVDRRTAMFIFSLSNTSTFTEGGMY